MLMGLHPSTKKVDGPYFDNFNCLLPYTTWFREVNFFVHLQTYLKQSGSISESVKLSGIGRFI